MLRSLLLGALCFASHPAFAQNPADRLGGSTWILCERATPSDHGRDALVFDADGSGRVIRAQGNMRFRYERSGDDIALRATDAAPPVMLSMDVAGQRLLLRGPDGRQMASYARQGSAAMARCTVS